MKTLYASEGRARGDTINQDETLAVAYPLISQSNVFLLAGSVKNFEHARLAVYLHLLAVGVFNCRVIGLDKVVQTQLLAVSYSTGLSWTGRSYLYGEGSLAHAAIAQHHQLVQRHLACHIARLRASRIRAEQQRRPWDVGCGMLTNEQFTTQARRSTGLCKVVGRWLQEPSREGLLAADQLPLSVALPGMDLSKGATTRRVEWGGHTAAGAAGSGELRRWWCTKRRGTRAGRGGRGRGVCSSGGCRRRQRRRQQRRGAEARPRCAAETDGLGQQAGRARRGCLLGDGLGDGQSQGSRGLVSPREAYRQRLSGLRCMGAGDVGWGAAAWTAG